jgi:hypothetical protein
MMNDMLSHKIASIQALSSRKLSDIFVIEQSLPRFLLKHLICSIPHGKYYFKIKCQCFKILIVQKTPVARPVVADVARRRRSSIIDRFPFKTSVAVSTYKIFNYH